MSNSLAPAILLALSTGVVRAQENDANEPATNQEAVSESAESDTDKESFVSQLRYSRADTGKFGVYAYYRTIDGESDFPGATVDDDGFAAGIGFGGPVNNYLGAFMEIGGGALDTSYSGSSIVDDTGVFEWKVGLDYNVLKTRFTPVVTGTVGIMKQWVSRTDFEEWTLTYGIGGGFRYDITDSWFVKAIYQFEWTEFDGSSSATRYDGIFLSGGYAF